MLAARVRSLAAEVDPTLRVNDLKPLDEVRRTEQIASYLITAVVVALTVIALLLSALSIYALMSFTVAQRTREIGIRSALGADPGRIIRAVFSRAVTQLAVGVAFGSIAAITFGVLEPDKQVARDWPVLLAAVALLVLGVGLVSCVAPARRGLRIQPTEACDNGVKRFLLPGCPPAVRLCGRRPLPPAPRLRWTSRRDRFQGLGSEPNITGNGASFTT